MKNELKINCDMGEWDAPHLSYVDDKIMPLIDLTNIACGGHAGSKIIMKHTMTMAQKYDVLIGAHIGYEDKLGFGRTFMDMDESSFMDSIQKQMDLFLACCKETKSTPHHIKPHGALYHACNHNDDESEWILTISAMHPNLYLLMLPDSLLHKKAIKSGSKILLESFMDRTYADAYKLTPRSEMGSVIHDLIIAYEQYKNLANGSVTISSGESKPLSSETICIHGDNPAVLPILQSMNTDATF